MKILIVVGIFPPDIGGPATFVPLIAKKLVENNCDSVSFPILLISIIPSERLAAVSSDSVRRDLNSSVFFTARRSITAAISCFCSYLILVYRPVDRQYY